MFRAEVDDVTGNVGTAVKTYKTLLGAVRFIAEVTKERWASTWRIVDTWDNSTILDGSTS